MQTEMKRCYWFPGSPEFDTIDAAIEEWEANANTSLPTSIFWTEYGIHGESIGQGSIALEAPHGTVIYW